MEMALKQSSLEWGHCSLVLVDYNQVLVLGVGHYSWALVLEQEHYNLAQGDYNLVLEHCSLVLVLEQGYCSLV